MKKFYLITLVLLLAGGGLFAQTNFFKQAPEGDPSARMANQKVSKKGIYKLDETGIRKYLKGAPMEFSNNGASLALAIPLPDGETETFQVVESPVLSPAVAADHPGIKTYSGKGLVNKKAVIRISLTPNGLNAIILHVKGAEAVYMEKSSGNIYFNYFTKDAHVPKNAALKGGTGGQDFKIAGSKPPVNPAARVSGMSNTLSTGGNLTIFRLAMAADGEFVANHGGTAASAFNDIVAYVNRINAFYRNELSVGFTLVSGTNLVYPDAGTDPYNNEDQFQMITQNTIVCDDIIGSANYDIGHVMGSFPGTTGGGLAYLQAVCNNLIKGGGASNEGSADVIAQSINDKLIFHEFGHQFGMSHSYNSSVPVCTTREPGTSVEPGAGITVMSYGMICFGNDDLGDDYYPFVVPEGRVLLQFHTINYQQAVAYLASLTYPPGVVVTNTGNSPPVITMPPNYTIPKSTPFALTGSATDANNDALTYAWEGTNTGGDETHPPDASTLANTAEAPFSRTYAPAATATRTFPIIDGILNGSNNARADKLPSVTVAANYNLTVRDNNPSGGGVSFGSVTVNVDENIGPFLETTNLAASYAGLSSQAITWSVNGTNAATSNVKISLSTDGGYTFPTILAASTPNDGSELITLPNINTTTARIKVEAIGNIFFDISNADFTINAVATYNIVATTGANGTVTPAGTTSVTSGANQIYAITPDAGFTVAGVLVDGVSVGAVTMYTFPNVTATHTISATFSAVVVNYIITASAGANGAISPSGAVSVASGTNKTFNITANSGYAVQSVLVDGVSQGAITTYTFTNVTATHTISASFVAVAGQPLVSNAGNNLTITLPTSSVILDGSASTGNILQYYWYQAQGPVQSVIGNNFSVFAGASGLTVAGTYIFGLQVKDNVGGIAYSYKTITVNPAPAGSVPACVTNTSPANGSTIATQTAATLSWPSSATATSYDVYLAAGTGIPATLVANTASLTYSASGLSAGTTYSWYIAPRNASGPATACGTTNKTTFTTATAGNQPLTCNAGGNVTFALPTSSVSLNGTASTGNIVQYYWYQAQGPGQAVIGNNLLSVTTATGLTTAGTYVFGLQVKDNVGGIAYSYKTVTVTPAGPGSVPACVTNTSPVNGSTIATQTTATLTWPSSATATSYDVYLAAGTGIPTVLKINTASLTYSATGLTAGTTYSWYIAPRNASGPATACGTTNKTTFATAAAGTQPLVANAGSGATITLPTSSVALNGSASTGNIVQYYWYQAQGPVQAVIGNSLSSVTTATGLTTAGTYVFGLQVKDNLGVLAYASKTVIVKAAGTTIANSVARAAASLEAGDNSSLPTVTAVINPNPVVTGQQAKLQINSNKAGTVMVNIVSSTGTIIGTKKVNLAACINTTTVSTAGLARGFHVISISGSAKPLNLKLIVQ